MHFFAIAFLIGDLYIQTLSKLPSYFMLVMMGIISFMIAISLRKLIRYYYLPLVFVLGMLWSTWYAHSILSWILPHEWEGKPIWIKGYIASLPVKTLFGSQFEFSLVEIKNQQNTFNGENTKIRLFWQNNRGPVRAGGQYELLVRLKRIHVTQNPGAFDFEAWALQKGMRATGYVVTHKNNKFLTQRWYHYPILQLRQHLQDKIEAQLPHSQTAPWLMALMVGERKGISQEDWQVLRNTGTNHLMAIGGLHIGILAGFIYYLVSWCWRRVPWLVLRLPVKQASMMIALLIAMVYSTLAGFSIPTQRASLMFVIVMLAMQIKRKINTWHAWSLAMSLVILFNPLTILTESFWLSFGALALIIYGMSGRLAAFDGWFKFGRMQWVIGLGLIPFTLVLFQECSLITFFANSVAVPWMEFLILPFCFLSILFIGVSPSITHALLCLADKSLTLLWFLLSSLAHFHGLTFQWAMPNVIIFFLMLFSLLLLLAPSGFKGRWLGCIGLLPLLFYKPVKPLLGDFWVTVLDVGQGLSVIVQTKQHLLIYDAGPKYANFNAGDSIIVPYLRTLSVSRIDKLVISHGDNDHTGGIKPIVTAYPVKQVMTNNPAALTPLLSNAAPCLAGQTWTWDQVEFTFLHPTENNEYQGNNSSCVLRIDNGQHRLLLSGDIERKGEEDLLKRLPEELATYILIAPHHGSKTSGLSAFIAKVHPHIVVYSTGYRNRYHFPHAMIVSAYQKIQAIQLDTMETGAIQFKIERNIKNISFDLYRISHKRYWMD